MRADGQSPKDRGLPWEVLAVAAGMFALLTPTTWLQWTDSPSPAWAQDGFNAVGAVAVGVVAVALMTTRMASVVESPGMRPNWGFLRMRLLNWTAVGALAGTFLAVMAVPAGPDVAVAPTAAVSDLATVGAVAGLAACVPAAFTSARQSLRSLRTYAPRWYAQMLVATGVVALMIIATLAKILD